MRAFFFGIYELGLSSLRRLLESGAEVVGVATTLQDEAHLGPCADLARRRNLPVFATGRERDNPLDDSSNSNAPHIVVVSDYLRLISREMLELAALVGIMLRPRLPPREP